MALERVQKILAQAGIASRRKAEELIAEGEVTINGRIARLGDKAEFGKDAIKVRGKLIHQVQSPVYLAFHKPRGVISMLEDPEGRTTLASYLSKVQSRVFPVGRLDYNSEGLILLTNDGAFAEKLQRRDDIPRVYLVKVKGHPNAEMLSRVGRGIKLENRLIRPHSVRVSQDLASKSMVEVVMMGAGAFDLKSLFQLKGFLVEKIVRTAIGHLTLHGMRPGEFRYLKQSQAEALLEQPELGMRRLERIQELAKPGEERREARLERDREREREKELAATPPQPKAAKRKPLGRPRGSTGPRKAGERPRGKPTRSARSGGPKRGGKPAIRLKKR